MRKKKRKISIQIILALVIISLSSTILAEDELQVKGAAVYVVYTAPLIDDVDLLKYCGYSDIFYKPPYFFYKELHSEDLEEKRKQLETKPNCLSATGFVEHDLGVICNYGGIEIFYDGYWLVGRKNITEKDELRNLSELYRLSWDYYKTITNLIVADDIRTDLGLENITETRFLTYIHFNEIVPYYLAEGNISRVLGTYEFSLNQSYQRQICEYLSEAEDMQQDCSERMIPLYFALNDPNKFKYLLRVREENITLTRKDYNKFIVVMEAEDGFVFLEHFLSPVNHLMLDDEVIEYSVQLLEETKKLQENLSTIREQLRNGTKLGSTADSRIANLTAIRDQLDLKEDGLENITRQINKIREYYESRIYQINNLPYYQSSDLLLFEKETRDKLNSISNGISEFEGYTDQIERTLNNLWDNYHAEYKIASDEFTFKKTIESSNVNNLYTIILSIIAALVVVITSESGATPNKDLCMYVIKTIKSRVGVLLICILLLLALVSGVLGKLYPFGLSLLILILLVDFLICSHFYKIKKDKDSNYLSYCYHILKITIFLFIFSLLVNLLLDISKENIGYIGDNNKTIDLILLMVGIFFVIMLFAFSKKETPTFVSPDNKKLDKISKEVSESSVESRKLFESLLRSQRSSLAFQERMVREQRNTEETLKRLSDSFKEETGVLEGKLDGISHEYRNLEDDFEDLSNSLDELRRRFGSYGDESS